jgi:hypothetical protein
MTARDTIDRVIFRAALDGLGVSQTADMVIAAVRAMPVEDQAELIGGRVEYHPSGLHQVSGPTRQATR